MRVALRGVGIAVAAIALLAVGFVAGTWAPDRSVEELAERWAQPPSRFVEVGALRVHLRDEGVGDGVPLLLLHGTSASLHTWDGWVEQLRSGRRIVRVDLPGFGLTGPAEDGNYTVEAYVRFVVALLDTLDVDRVAIAGNSFGGRIAWETAVSHPSRVAALLLVDASGYPMTAGSMPLAFTLAQTPVVDRIMEVTLPRFVVESGVRDVYGDPSKVTPELVDRYYELALREGNRRALAERFRQAAFGDTATRISEVAVPTLVLWGREDRLNPLDFAERFHRDIRGSRLVVYDGLGHVPHEEDPITTAADARAFLASVDGMEAEGAPTAPPP